MIYKRGYEREVWLIKILLESDILPLWILFHHNYEKEHSISKKATKNVETR